MLRATGETWGNFQKEFCKRLNQVKLFQKGKQPVISVDTKKKENIGNYKNAGQEYSHIPIKMFQKNILFLTVLLLSKWDKNIGMLLLSGRVVVHLTKSCFQFSIGDYMKWPGCRPFNQVFFSIFNW